MRDSLFAQKLDYFYTNKRELKLLLLAIINKNIFFGFNEIFILCDLKK